MTKQARPSRPSRPAPRRRWWLQCSLRALLAMTLACGAVCGWLGAALNQYRQEQRVIQEIQLIAGPMVVS